MIAVTEESPVSQIICGDALTILKTLPSEYVQCCITSPPYFGLRNYGVDGQIGLEETPERYTAKLVEVFREVKRVLREDGTLWLNIGDSYAAGKAGRTDYGTGDPTSTLGPKHDGLPNNTRPGMVIQRSAPAGYKPKDLIGIPWLLAFALRADGWYLRQDIIWQKPNCMPESVKDRPTKSHEYLFLLSKSERYFYDADAIREPIAEATIEREKTGYNHAFASQFRGSPSDKRHPDGKVLARISLTQGRNKRSVWTIATQPFKNAHFATMPQKLVEPCVLAGSSAQACEHCGSPWERVTERFQFGKAESNTAYTDDKMRPNRLAGSRQAYRAAGFENPPAPITVGWQSTCTCSNEGTGKSIVLDPFAGAGTVPLVAIQHERHYLGIELNPAYVEMSEHRIHKSLGIWGGVKE